MQNMKTELSCEFFPPQTAEGVAKLRLVRATLAVLYPLVALSNTLSWSVLRLLGIRRRATTRDLYTPEELQLIVEESEHGGALRSESGRLLHELFEFGDLTAGEAMVPRVRKNETRIARPIADSAAATVSTKNTKICPSMSLR